MPGVSAASKRQPLTLAQISSYDDILTDALIDHVSAAVREGTGDRLGGEAHCVLTPN